MCGEGTEWAIDTYLLTICSRTAFRQGFQETDQGVRVGPPSAVSGVPRPHDALPELLPAFPCGSELLITAVSVSYRY